MNVLDAIGNTSIVRLDKVAPAGCRIFAKLEWENPTGSMKDRMALAVISRAESDGRLRPGGTVLEYTGGSTGTSLALIAAARGYRCGSSPRTPSAARSATTWPPSARRSSSSRARAG